MGTNVTLAIVAFVFGSVFFFIGWRDRQKNLAAMTWPTVKGVIVGSEIDSYIRRDDDGDETTLYEPLVTYEYEVEGDHLPVTGSPLRASPPRTIKASN